MAEERLGGAYFDINFRDNTGSGLNSVNSSFSQLEQIVATNWWGLQNLGRAFAAIPAAAAAGMGVAINYAKQWEDVMFEVGRTSGETGVALDKISDSLLRISRTTPIAATELGQLASEGAALGIANENLAEFARVMGLTVASTNLTADGVENVARVLNIMQVPVEEYEQFSSALIDIGRNTAATETDIITAAKRLATVGASAGASSPQVLAMGAALRSLGPEAEAGATAINKTITGMAKAVNEQGKELAAFAQIAGISIEEFSQMVKTNAYDALELYLVGLGKLPDALVGVQKAFAATNADGVRQQQALATLARGTQDAGSAQRDYVEMLAMTEEQYRRGSVLSEIEAQKMNTLTGQMQLLKNAVFEAGQAFGAMLLPAVKWLVSGPLGFLARMVTDIAVGFKTLHPVFQGIVSGASALVLGLMAVAAAAITVGARVVIAIGAYRRLSETATQAKITSDTLTSSAARTGQQMQMSAVQAEQYATALVGLTTGLRSNTAATQMSEATARQYASSLVFLTTGLQRTAGANVTEAAATGVATRAHGRAIGVIYSLRSAYAGLSTAVRGAALSSLAMAGAMVGMTYWMRQQGQAARQAAEQHEAGLARMKIGLAEVVAQNQDAGKSSKDIQKVSMSYLQAQDSYKQMADSARSAKVDIKDLNAVITGSGAKGERIKTVNDVFEQASKGDKDAQQLFTRLKELHGAYGSVRDSARDTSTAISDFSEKAKDAGKSASDLANTLEQQARAHIDIIGSLFSAREAQLALQDAEDNLDKARRKQAGTALEIEKAELQLVKARFSHQKALRSLQKAERDLGTSRERGRESLASAEDSLANARDRYRDSLERIAEIEKDLDKLRKGPTIEELTKATNALRNAQLRLLGAVRMVSDAEWNLQYLRQQGASTRDLEDAEFSLLEARQDVANQQQSVNETEQELADLRDNVKRQQKAIKMERDLASARRSSREALRSLRDGEREVADLRQRVANDTFYKEAQEDLVDAQLRVKGSLNDIFTAEMELRALRSGSLMRDVEKNQLAYEQALWKVAQANVEVQRQEAAMRGEFWNSGQAASALATELGRMTENIPDAEARRRMEQFMSVLKAAPVVPDIKDVQQAFEDMGEGLDMGPVMDAAFDDLDFEFPEGAFDGNMGDSKWWEPLVPMIGFAAAPLLTAAIGAAAGALGVSSVFVGLAAAAAVGWLLFLYRTDWGKKFSDFYEDKIRDPLYNLGRDMVTGLWNGFTEWGAKLLRGIGNWLYQRTVKPIKELFGIESPSTVFMDIGKELMSGLWEGIKKYFRELLGNLAGWLFNKIVSPLKGAWDWLTRTGGDIMSGLWRGLQQGWNIVSNLFAPARWVAGKFVGAVGWLLRSGYDIINGMWNGLSDAWGRFRDWFKPWDWIKSFFSGSWNWLKQTGSDIIGGLGRGLGVGMKVVEGNVTAGMQSLVTAVRRTVDAKSPSRVFDDIGRWMMEGLRNGIDRGLIGVTDSMEEVFRAVDLQQRLKSNNLEYLLTASGGMGTMTPYDIARANGMTTPSSVVNYGDTVQIDVESNADAEDIANAYVWKKRIRSRG